MEKSSLKALGCLLMLLAVPVVTVISIFVNGFVTRQLWEWFAVPLGVPAITLFQAAGVGLLFGYLSNFTDTSDLAKKEDANPVVDAVSKIVMLLVGRPLLYLFVGWAILYLQSFSH